MGNIEHNKHRAPNSPNMAVFIEHDIAGHIFLLIPQENGHKSWVRIVTMIDDHEIKVAQKPSNIQFIN